MAIHIVSYDLQEGTSRRALWGTLKKAGAVRLLPSFWLISTTQSANELRDGLRALIAEHDALAVIELNPSSDWALAGAKPAGVEWLQKFMP